MILLKSISISLIITLITVFIELSILYCLQLDHIQNSLIVVELINTETFSSEYTTISIDDLTEEDEIFSFQYIFVQQGLFKINCMIDSITVRLWSIDKSLSSLNYLIHIIFAIRWSLHSIPPSLVLSLNLNLSWINYILSIFYYEIPKIDYIYPVLYYHMIIKNSG